MPNTSDAQLRANARYDAANTKRFGIKLNMTWDADVIMLLDSINKPATIKQLLREYISARRPGVTDDIYSTYIRLSEARDSQD